MSTIALVPSSPDRDHGAGQPLHPWLGRVADRFARLAAAVAPRRVGRRRPLDHRGWADDPLSHPDLRTMTLDQLADLPFGRTPDRS